MKAPKTTLIALLALAGGLLTTQAQAQTVPNGGLDTWARRGAAEAPTGWLTTDDIAASQGLPIATNTVVKTAVARSGAFAAQLQTQTFPVLGPQPGVLILGTVLNINADFPGGIAFTGRPARLEFYHKLTGAQAVADSAVAQVQLTRRVGGVRRVVAGATYLFRATSASYSLVSVPLTYLLGVQPDSARIIFASGVADNLNVGTVLTIDDVAFAGTTTATRDAALNAALAVTPNPSPDGRYRLWASPEAAPGLLAAPLTVRDATGRVVLREAAPAPTTAAAGRALDLSGLPEGIYTLQLFAPGGLVTRKLVR